MFWPSPDDRIVFLDTPFEVCYERIRDSDRPIVRRSTPNELRAAFGDAAPPIKPPLRHPSRRRHPDNLPTFLKLTFLKKVFKLSRPF